MDSESNDDKRPITELYFPNILICSDRVSNDGLMKDASNIVLKEGCIVISQELDGRSLNVTVNDGRTCHTKVTKVQTSKDKFIPKIIKNNENSGLGTSKQDKILEAKIKKKKFSFKNIFKKKKNSQLLKEVPQECNAETDIEKEKLAKFGIKIPPPGKAPHRDGIVLKNCLNTDTIPTKEKEPSVIDRNALYDEWMLQYKKDLNMSTSTVSTIKSVIDSAVSTSRSDSINIHNACPSWARLKLQKERKKQNLQTMPALGPYYEQDIQNSVLAPFGYDVGKIIGRGAFSIVRVAVSRKHQHKKVAIKIIGKFQAPQELIKKFLPREIGVVKTIKHRNIIRFLTAIESTHRVYLVMELAESGSLLHLLSKHGKLTELKAKNLFSQLTSAVSYCHDNGIAHRDIKCENILFDKSGVLKLSDFGFAKTGIREINGVFPTSRTYCGSYAYASPEILQFLDYRPHLADIWSMGVVLWAMVYGKLPFDSSSYSKLVKQVLTPIVFPTLPPITFELKDLLKNIFLLEETRYNIRKIKEDNWLKKSKEIPKPNEEIERQSSNIETTETSKPVKKCKSISHSPVLKPVHKLAKTVMDTMKSKKHLKDTARNVGTSCYKSDESKLQKSIQTQEIKEKPCSSKMASVTYYNVKKIQKLSEPLVKTNRDINQKNSIRPNQVALHPEKKFFALPNFLGKGTFSSKDPPNFSNIYNTKNILNMSDFETKTNGNV